MFDIGGDAETCSAQPRLLVTRPVGASAIEITAGGERRRAPAMATHGARGGGKPSSNRRAIKWHAKINVKRVFKHHRLAVVMTNDASARRAA